MLLEAATTNNLRYFSDPEHYPFFYTDKLINVVDKLRSTLPDEIQIAIHPDATLKANRLPTGICCTSKTSHCTLLPYILRDPGCGFLMFKIKFPTQDQASWQSPVGTILSNLENLNTFHKIKNNILSNITIENIAKQGMLALNIVDDLIKFRHTSFPVSDQLDLKNHEIELLTNDFMKVTNTTEIRKLSGIQIPELLQKHSIAETDFIGFIHSGSLVFPTILSERFVYRICEYGHQNNLFDLADIANGIIGVPLNTPLGSEYENWLNAAMNFALASRYCNYLAVKEVLENNFNCEVSLLDDNIHAGLFTNMSGNDETSYISRGVQHIENNKLSLLAGQRETPAALIAGTDHTHQYGNLFAHGTGYHIRDDFDYNSAFKTDELNKYLDDAHKAFYNSNPNYIECIPYTFNLLTSLDFYQKIGLAKTVALLSPVINIQSEWLQQDNEVRSL